MTEHLRDPHDCFVVTSVNTSDIQDTLLLFHSRLEYLRRTPSAKWHFKAYFDACVSTLNDQPMSDTDFARLGDFLGPIVVGLQTGQMSLVKGHI